MTADEYLADRLDGQIDWLNRKSGWNKSWFIRLRTVEILCAGVIPLLAGVFGSEEDLALAIALGSLGVLVAFLAGFLTLVGFHENWVGYRATCEVLQQHRYKYLTQVAPYDGDDAFHALVQNVEDVLSDERMNWSEQASARNAASATT